MNSLVVGILACSSEHSNGLLGSNKGRSLKSLSEKWLISRRFVTFVLSSCLHLISMCLLTRLLSTHSFTNLAFIKLFNFSIG